MKFETLQNLTLPKISFGCWTIGGQSSPDLSKDERFSDENRALLNGLA